MPVVDLGIIMTSIPEIDTGSGGENWASSPWGEASQEQRSENPRKIPFQHLRISNALKGQGQLSEKSKGFVECSPLKRGGLGRERPERLL